MARAPKVKQTRKYTITVDVEFVSGEDPEKWFNQFSRWVHMVLQPPFQPGDPFEVVTAKVTRPRSKEGCEVVAGVPT